MKTITLNSFRAPLSNEVLLDIWDRKVESQNSACERPTRPSSLFPPPSYHGDHSNHASAGRFSIKGSRVSALCIRRFLSCKIHKICAFCREFATIFWRIVAKLCELKVEIVLKAGGWPLTSTLNDGVVQAVTFGHLTDWLISFCQNSSTSWFARKFAMDISYITQISTHSTCNNVAALPIVKIGNPQKCYRYWFWQHSQQTVDMFLRALWGLDLNFDSS